MDANLIVDYLLDEGAMKNALRGIAAAGLIGAGAIGAYNKHRAMSAATTKPKQATTAAAAAAAASKPAPEHTTWDDVEDIQKKSIRNAFSR